MERRGLKPLGVSLIALIIVALIIIGFVVFSNKSPTANAIVSGNINETKLSNSPYSTYSYLISSDTLSPEAQQAISGFSLNKQTNSDGTITINLIALNSEYQNQSYTLKAGQSLYFIERSWGDDGNGSENFLGDDHAIITDSNGYIVQGPTTFN